MTSQSERESEFAVIHAEISSLDRLYTERFKAQETAINKAFAAKQDHDEHANKVVATLREVIANCLTKDEYERRHQDLVDKIEALRSFRAEITGRESVMRAMAVLAGIVIGLVGVWLRSK